MAKEVQCDSCPFLKTNFAEFNAVAKKLSKQHNQPEPDFFQCLTIRKRVTEEGIQTGRLLCHSTVYDEQMTGKLEEEAKSCAGLVTHLKQQRRQEKRNGQ